MMNGWWWRRVVLHAILPLAVIWFSADAVTGRVPSWVAWKIPAAHGASPTAFGVKWAQQYNQAAYTANDPWRIHQIACVNTKYRGVYACLLREQNKATRKVKCYVLGLTTTQYVFDVKPHKCPGPSA